MRLLFLAAYAANLILAGALLLHRPAAVLADFGVRAAPQAWRANAVPVAALVSLYTLLLVAILLATRLLRFCPARWVSIPNPDYWLQDANRAVAGKKIQARLLSFGTVTFLILLLAGIFVLRFQQAPQSQPEWWKLRGVALLFLAYSIYWYFGVLRDFRVPDQSRCAARNV